MFHYCPHCASPDIQFTEGKLFFCPACSFTYYHNTAAASGIIIESDGRILTLVRGKEPGKGKLDFPGGFVDPGEGIIDAICRECREELSWDPGKNINLLASFANQYPYKNILYNTCDVFFTVNVPGLHETDFSLDEENSQLYITEPKNINPDDFAFVSARKAFLLYLNSKLEKRG
ncbi:MAG: NUDIX domain-containing protein [Treponema sp.]|jgi:ADP-ribose pyrophosphatase YjhB (NUDIX family)|nr:NUDIX domain-containing protein [Treponema sp.]